jgi:hypothetical protein
VDSVRIIAQHVADMVMGVARPRKQNGKSSSLRWSDHDDGVMMRIALATHLETPFDDGQENSKGIG